MEGSEFFMADEFRHQRANDGACLGGHCADREALQSSIRHDFVLLSILEHFMLLIIVFLIEDKEGAPSATTVLVLNANFISFEVSSELEQVVVAADGGTDVRDEGDIGFGQ
jgi:hypothetical protein